MKEPLSTESYLLYLLFTEVIKIYFRKAQKVYG